MSKGPKLKTEKINVMYSVEEMAIVRKKATTAGYRHLGKYVRAVSLQKPVRTYVRNLSFDEYVGEAIVLRRELQQVREEYKEHPGEWMMIRDVLEKILDNLYKIYLLCMSR